MVFKDTQSLFNQCHEKLQQSLIKILKILFLFVFGCEGCLVEVGARVSFEGIVDGFPSPTLGR